MDSLAKVLAAKKRELSAIKAEKEKKNEKYLRRADAERLLYQQQQKQQQEELARKQASRPSHSDDGERSASKKRRLESRERPVADGEGASSTERTQQALSGSGPGTGAAEDEDEVALAWPEMKRRLRDLAQPIALFGETTQQRLQRLRRAEHDAASRREEELGEGHDIRNQFVGHQQDDAAGGAQRDDDDDDDGGDAPEQRRRGGDGSAAADGSAGDAPEPAETELADDVLVYRFFKSMLLRWEQDLADRPDHVKRTAQGKLATKTMKQCKDYIRPLFKLCKRRQVPADILPNLVEIVRFCRQGEFVRANDAYIRLAIGNAAWPIGVTMVGIHERTGREKINANKQAHVMNNEAQRKYITSVKRLISYAQSIASVLPSKKVA
ncbi:hypothetical protein P43SY_008957 [Pythium insidiosum]|uniref:Pre-mRNA-splicing factor 18 n=1 Tax=Pythium insidiosum TaxID=114742 RepID=A0AAD5QAA2_PYTIN|nr:hypothetical protein P43SY_008957 [Pythium insidiosum]